MTCAVGLMPIKGKSGQSKRADIRDDGREGVMSDGRERLVLTGGSGLLSLNWAISIKEKYAVTLAMHERMVELNGVESGRLNLNSVDELVRSLDLLSPNLVIHTVGMTNIEACEKNPDLARHVNVELAANVARACSLLGVPLVHISTDHLFSGDSACVTEAEVVNPQNVYAKTKAEAEQQVLEFHAGALVVRTNFYAWGPSYRKSFSDIILDALSQGQSLSLFQDVYYTPILAESLVHAVHDMVEKKAHGIFHVAGDERVSKYDFGMKLAQAFGLDGSLLETGLLADMPDLVRRPYDMSLSNRKACDFLGRNMGSTEDCILKLLEQKQVGIAQKMTEL